MKSLILGTSVLCWLTFLSGRASFKVFVIDSETDRPIPNAKIEGSFLNAPKGWWVEAKNNDVDAWTDSSGYATLSGSTDRGAGGYRIYKTPGYYNAEWREIQFDEQSGLRLGAWQPNDIVSTARLDRIVNPIPLYVRKTAGKYRQRKRGDYVIDTTYKEFSTAVLATNKVLNVSNATMAYDMVMGEWLPPIGNGHIADITFRFDEELLGWKIADGHGISIYKMFKMNSLISIPGRGNGILEVIPTQNAGIKLRIAPKAGYESSLTRWQGRFGDGGGDKTDCDKKRCYAFRIRTEYDGNGNIKSAYYGKIYDDFDLINFEGVGFLYYLNPTPNDRNLEWDMKNNLCPKPGFIGEPRP